MSQLSLPTVANVETGRDVYLKKTLHLNHDPFANPVAEWEIQLNPDDPPFFRYFVDPPYENQEEETNSLLDNLQQPGTAVVFGAAGSGKTMLCYRLDAACRELAAPTLMLSQVLGKDASLTDPNAFWQKLTEGLAVDLFVQTLERFDSIPLNTLKELTPSLAHYWARHIPQFTRNVKRHLAQQQKHETSGLSAQWWSVWQRTAVRYTPFNRERVQFLTNLLTVPTGWSNGTMGEMTFQTGISLAKQLGFQQVFLLVDVVEAIQREESELENHIRALWRYLLPLSVPLPFYPKFFLPLRLKPLMESLIAQTPLISPVFSAIMNWSDPQVLTELVENRFRSAGGWIKGLDVLASEEIVSELSEAILRVANHSPRRLLQLHSLLIDAHVSRDPTDRQITAVDWQRLCDLWSYGSPYPTPLMSSAAVMRS